MDLLILSMINDVKLRGKLKSLFCFSPILGTFPDEMYRVEFEKWLLTAEMIWDLLIGSVSPISCPTMLSLLDASNCSRRLSTSEASITEKETKIG